MKWKIVVVGGLVFFVATWVVGFPMGMLIHDGVLKEAYDATSEFWRPELNQDPPDMAALMPLWITTGLLTSFVVAGLYGCFRSALSGPGWRRGLVFGLCLTFFYCSILLSFSGMFNLPWKIWIWWCLESPLYYLVGGAALGWVAEKLEPAA